MRVLVTGCGGFIGGYVCRELKDAGHTVYGLGSRRGQSDVRCLDEYYAADISSPAEAEAAAKALGKADAVIHCAAYISYDDTDSRTMQVNVVGTQNMVTLAKHMGAHKFIYCSSVPVIGVPTELPITEAHPLAPQTMYHVSKLAGEHIVNAAKLPSAILRIPSPVGPGMNPASILPVFVTRSLRNEPILLHGTGGRVQNYVSVMDVARAARLSLAESVNGCFNLSGDAISNLALAQLCREVLHAKSAIDFSGKPDPADKYVWDISGARAAQELGFTPRVGIEETIRMLADQASAMHGG